MPFYKYRCGCGKEFDAMRSVEQREEAPCLACGSKAKHVITAAHFDPKMGLDPDFETFSSKWAKSREKASRSRT